MIKIPSESYIACLYR